MFTKRIILKYRNNRDRITSATWLVASYARIMNLWTRQRTSVMACIKPGPWFNLKFVLSNGQWIDVSEVGLFKLFPSFFEFRCVNIDRLNEEASLLSFWDLLLCSNKAVNMNIINVLCAENLIPDRIRTTTW